MNRPAVHTVMGSLLILLSVGCGAAYEPAEALRAQLPATVDFNYHIKPVLSDRCFTCHGPDKNALKAELRLDTYEGALQKALTSGRRAFVPGSLRKSEAFQRITSGDPEVQMPPPEAHLRLSEYDIALIARWIEQGAEYKPHWAFLPIQQPPLPSVQQASWVQNPIDGFVLHKLEANGFAPNVVADKEILLRRVTLDLSGLPPTPEEIDRFLADETPSAYKTVVNRLLASPRYGERMALEWLDVARYADSNGYSQDGLRTMWPWRDWVIKAFNDNMPYDRFIMWQVAGDRMPEATQEQRLATGFLRNHRMNGEGGIVEEEYRIEYVADRTETTATAFLGLTLQCARCHDHKYDPISQEAYYRMFAFFNSVNESGMAQNDGNSGPQVLLKSPEVEADLARLDQKIQAKKAEAEKVANQIPPDGYRQTKVDLDHGLLLDLSFDTIRDNSIINDADPRESFEIDTLNQFQSSVKGKAFRFTGYDAMMLVKEDLEFDREEAFSIGFDLKSHHEQTYMAVLNHLGSSTVSYPGYDIAIIEGYPTFRLVHALPANLIAIRTAQPIEKGEWHHYVFTYDGSGKANGITVFVDGKKEASVVLFDQLTQSITNNNHRLKIGGGIDYQTERDGFGLIDALKIYNRRLSEREARTLYHEVTASSFSDATLKEHYVLNHDSVFHAVWRELQQLRTEKFQIQDTLMGVMVMEDLPTPRPTFVLERGMYDAPREQVEPGTPEALSPFPEGAPVNRLGLAEWLVADENPLTARVAVNRFWQMYFGRGLAKTTEDFGNQGALPTHSALLDWLAASFIESGWDTKALQKMIVLSATYQQSSRVPENERKADPDNALLARGPSRRLSAELIRDVALAASGLLVDRIGGPSVKPYQPEGLWSEKGEFSVLKNYEQDTGGDLYRRGLYTFWRRTSPLPSMTMFDAPTRDVCEVRRQETNTPLQALVLLNDPQFVEAARVLAERVIRTTPDKAEQITLAYRLLTGLAPSAEVLVLLTALEQKERDAFVRDTVRSRQLLGVGEYPADQGLNSAEVAAMTMVGSTIMSFDETLVKR